MHQQAEDAGAIHGVLAGAGRELEEQVLAHAINRNGRMAIGVNALLGSSAGTTFPCRRQCSHARIHRTSHTLGSEDRAAAMQSMLANGLRNHAACSKFWRATEHELGNNHGSSLAAKRESTRGVSTARQ